MTRAGVKFRMATSDNNGSKGEKFELSVGSKVRITAGPFQRFTGTITAIDQQSRRVKVKVDIFGRPQPVELDFADIVAEE
jgi:transcription antitermination factor NusG